MHLRNTDKCVDVGSQGGAAALNLAVDQGRATIGGVTFGSTLLRIATKTC